MVDDLHERRRLNDEIERTFIQVASHSRNILTYRQTMRGISVMTLYENFYSEFSLLVLLTSDLPQVKKDVNSPKKAEEWLKIHSVPENATDKYIIQRCYDGVEAFKDYKKVLQETGVISMPSK